MKSAQAVDFPITISSSLLSDWASCQRKAYWSYFRRQKLKEINVDLLAGDAFAKGLERARKAYYVDKMSQEDAEEEGVMQAVKVYGMEETPEKNPKSWDRVAGALLYYFQHYPFATDVLQPYVTAAGPVIEFSFAIESSVLHPQTGEPLLITGRFDELGQHKTSVYCVDEKTTKTLGPTWAQRWETHGQFMCYTWAALAHGYPVKGVFVRGIAIRKDGYEIAESSLQFTKEQIDTWYKQSLRQMEDMKRAWAEREFNQDGFFSGACFNYFRDCSFKRLCLTSQPEIWLPQYYETREFKPRIEASTND